MSKFASTVMTKARTGYNKLTIKDLVLGSIDV